MAKPPAWITVFDAQSITYACMNRRLLIAMVFLFTTGCGITQPFNLSFPIETTEARDALDEMEESPQRLQRPVIVLSGFMGPGWLAQSLSRTLQSTADEGQFETASFLFKSTFDDCRDHVIDVVDKAWPNDNPATNTDETIEVDVIAISMGGVVARYAAMPLVDAQGKTRRRLKIARLFTISSPHRGAKMASLPSFDSKQINMRPGSRFIAELNDAWAAQDYTLFAYVRIGDTVVGQENAAPPGEMPWWVSNKFLEGAHLGAHRDERILADIARRLRGEEPFTRYPPLPFPNDDNSNN